MDLETKVKAYIKDNSKEYGMLMIPLSKMASELDSSTATIWRAIQRLEDRRIIKVIKPKVKTQPNAIYYLGEQEDLGEVIDDMMVRTSTLLIMMKELREKLKQKDDTIFELERKELTKK